MVVVVLFVRQNNVPIHADSSVVAPVFVNAEVIEKFKIESSIQN